MVRRGRRGPAPLDRYALRRLRLLAPAGGRAPSGQSRRHAHGLVGARGRLRPPRAAPRRRAGASRLLARHPGHGLLRRGRTAQTRCGFTRAAALARRQDAIPSLNFFFMSLASCKTPFSGNQNGIGWRTPFYFASSSVVKRISDSEFTLGKEARI